MNYFEAMRELEEGKKVRNVNWIDGLYLFKEENKICFSETTKVKCLNDVDLNFGPWEIYKEPILTDEEKEYLRNTIKFCFCPVETIKLLNKVDNVILKFASHNDNTIDFSFYFKKDYFKNMEPNRPYTLKELGLDE